MIDCTPENDPVRLLRTKSVSTGFFRVLYLSFLPPTDAPVLLTRPAPDSYTFDAILELNVPLRLWWEGQIWFNYMLQSSVFTQNTYSFYITIQVRIFYSFHAGSYVGLPLWGSCTDLHTKL